MKLFIWIVGLSGILLVHNPATAASILAPAAYSNYPFLGLACFALMFRQNNPMVPLFFGLCGMAVVSRIKWIEKILMIPAASLLALAFHHGYWPSQISWRLKTWRDLLKASLNHPIFGHGYNLLSMPVVLNQSRSPLPSAHSDWIALLFHGGMLSVVPALAVCFLICIPLVENPEVRGIQCSLLVFSMLCLVRNTADQPLVIPIVLGLLAWFLTKILEKEIVHA